MVRQVLGKGWSYFLEFLQIIGVREERKPDFSTRLSLLRLRYFQFRDLLSSNSDLLEAISDIEMRLQGAMPVSTACVRAKALAALTSTHRMVAAFEAISGAPYPALKLALSRVEQRVSACLASSEFEAPESPVLGLDQIDRSAAWFAGNKMASLGELKKRVGLPIPEGFVITTAASRRVLDAAGGTDTFLWSKAPSAGADLDAFARHARERILQTPLPKELEADIERAARTLAGPGDEIRLSVRSSALEEDSAVSFAGQYLTLLNVSGQGVCEAYRQVLASAFQPDVISYRHDMGLEACDLGMAVGCMAMLDAVASGVAFSRDPVAADADRVLIHAAWGLGTAVVDGRVDPDVYTVARHGESDAVTMAVQGKNVRFSSLPGGGLIEEAVPEPLRRQPCLETSEIVRLARWAVALEEHFGQPQDVEWALDRQRRLWVLQSRPSTARVESPPAPLAPPAEATVALEGGATAAHGAGAGPVFVVDRDAPLEAFPDGGVLVAGHSSPKFVKVMKRASAIVTDVGSAIGHMASLCREFDVPTIVGAAGATTSFSPGEIVTVDATARRVYRGRVEEVLAAHPRRPAGVVRGPAHEALEAVSAYIVPLNLTDPRDPGFTPLNCTTLHDLARYMHERSFQEMFGLSRLVGDVRAETPMLDVFLPIDLYVIDLGGGLNADPGARRLKRSQIASAPFAALVDGMLHPAIPRFGPRAMDAQGFFQVVMEQALSPSEWDRTLRDPCYAIISDRYVNLASRVGFHFSAVDAYCTDSLNQNYITFRFKGGAADEVRRARRVRAIAGILTALGFATEVKADLVSAQYLKQERASVLHTLDMLGRLLQFMRQMDAAMVSDGTVDRIVAAFLDGRYGLQPEPPAAEPA
jgi:pyruvate,water dikinase